MIIVVTSTTHHTISHTTRWSVATRTLTSITASSPRTTSDTITRARTSVRDIVAHHAPLTTIAVQYVAEVRVEAQIVSR